MSFIDHPSLDVLSDLAIDGAVADHTVMQHVATCSSCRDSLAFLRSLTRDVAARPAPAAPAALRARVLATAVNAVATPAAAPAPTPATPAATPLRATPLSAARGSRRRWFAGVGIAAAVVVAVGATLLATPHVQADTASGTLEMSATNVRPGERVSVRYTPGVSLAPYRALQLRGRIHSTNTGSYASSAPVVTLATLARQRDGSFQAAFTLPDSIVFAALAVEDTAATEIDDHGGKTWELFRADGQRGVTLDALEQRIHDVMGRNWEDIGSTAERMVAEFPDSVRAWSWLKTAQSWMGMSEDSINTMHAPKMAAFDSALRRSAALGEETIGRAYWYLRRSDSARTKYWDHRLLTEAPRSSFGVQARIILALDSLRANKDTTSALATMNTLWQEADIDRRSQVANYGASIARRSGDTAQIRRWTDRLLAGDRELLPSPTSSLIRQVAEDFLTIPALRDEGVRRLHGELARLAPPSVQRGLTERRVDFIARIDGDRRAVLATIGDQLFITAQRAGVSDRVRSLHAALDTLELAASAGWSVSRFTAVRNARFALSDSARAHEMTARLVIDPNTRPGLRDTMLLQATRQVGEPAFTNMIAQAKRELVARTMARAQKRALLRPVQILAQDGTRYELNAMAQGEITVVAFWSRYCGPAIDILPALHRMAARLGEEGVRTIIVAEENAPSSELRTFLKEHDVTLPVYLDAKGEAGAAFNSWGTPALYILDGKGRIPFRGTNDIEAVIRNVAAVRLANAQ